MIKTLACAFALGVLTTATLSSAGLAASAEPVQSETVLFGDLNLASPAGVQTLRQRLSSAARRVCDEQLGFKTDVFAKRRALTCQTLAVQRAQSVVAASRPDALRLAVR